MIESLKTHELETKIGERVKEHLENIKKQVTKELADLVWTACNDYVEYADYEPLRNWKDRERYSLVGAKYYAHKNCFWGKQMREKIFEEYKDTILPMIKDEQIEAMQKEIDRLNERVKFMAECERDRRY